MECKKQRYFHYVLMFFMCVVAVLSVVFVGLIINGVLKGRPVPSELVRAEEAGRTKLLPEYMLKTLKSDELEQLKP